LKASLIIAVFLVLAASWVGVITSHHGVSDPCDGHGDCVSSSISYVRSNPDNTLYLGDGFAVSLSVSMGPNASGYQTSWSFDPSVFQRSGSAFTVTGNTTGTFAITASVTFTGSVRVGNATQPFTSTLMTSQSVTLIPLIISLSTKLVNVTGSDGSLLRNSDGSFYPNDSFCDSWNATFRFAIERTDIRINVTSVTPPSLQVLNYSAGPLGRSGRFCYAVRTDSGYGAFDVVLKARALNWQGISLGLKESGQPFAVVRYDPRFTSYAYMFYRNSTASSSLRRPWVLLVRYDGNLPGYSYSGDGNTRSFNGSRTLTERAYFSDFRYSTLSYQPYTSAGVFKFHVTNSSGVIRYNWLNDADSAPLYSGMRIEKYVFNITASSLTPLLSQGFVYQNVTMVGCWRHEGVCDLRQNYWLVPSLWNGRLSIVSVDSSGNPMPSTPLTLTIHSPAPLDDWLTSGFERIFGSDGQALRAFEGDLYPTNETMSFSGEGKLSVWLNQTSLVPPLVTITAGDISLRGNFTFVPTFVTSTIASVPNSLNGTVYYANATIPIWGYNMVQDNLTYLPVATDIDYPSSFLELVNSSMWVAGNTTAPQTPSAFASQQYGFWPMGENLTVYANLQGGGVRLLGTQKVGPDQYQASFYFEPWSGGISSFQLIVGDLALTPRSIAGQSQYQTPLPQSVTGFYSVSYPATGQDTKVIFTNIWGGVTTIDLGTPAAPSPLINLIPATTVTAFGVAFIIWFIVSGILKTRKAGTHE
jgi:hypothetical protein